MRVQIAGGFCSARSQRCNAEHRGSVSRTLEIARSTLSCISGDFSEGWQCSCDPGSRSFLVSLCMKNRIRSVWLAALVVAATSCRASYPVTPTEPTPLSLQIYYRNPVALALVGSSYTFDAFTLRSDGAYENVTSHTTWSSSDPSVLRHNTVNSSTGAVFAAVAPGPADVVVHYRGFSSAVSMFVIRPDRRVYPQLSIGLPPVSSLSVGQKGQATASVLEIGAPAFEVVTDVASWSSSNPDVLRVERGGALTVVAPGTTHITASYNGLSAFVGVSVHPPRQAP